MKTKTSKELRELIISAKYEINEYEEFIKDCEKQLEKNYKKRTPHQGARKN